MDNSDELKLLSTIFNSRKPRGHKKEIIMWKF